MSQVITDAFSSYWQQCLVDQTPVVLDEFVLAHIPGLDPDAPIDPASGLPPPEQIVHRHTVDQRGRINNDAVAYSIVMDTTVGDFTFNAMYLINTALNLVGMIVHKGEETKLRTDPASGQTGNSLVKSMLMEYDRAAEASQTVIDASTWQIDYAARLRGMDEDMRRQAMGTFGHAAFYGDGFMLINDAGLYKVQPGQGYVGGLLVELAAEQEVIPSAKPVGLWLDVYRAGSLLSPWVNHGTLTLSTADLVDYVDANGYPHHVTKLATINSDDCVTDTRTKRTITLSGDVSGQAVLEGPDSVQITVTVQDNSHAHTIENVTGLQSALDGKSPTGHTHTPDEAGAAPAVHTHTPDQAGAAPAVHGHAIADVSGLQGALDGKAPTGHTHTVAEVGAVAPAVVLATGTDLNSVTTSGFYRLADAGTGHPNCPDPSGYGNMFVSRGGDTTAQIYVSPFTGVTYTRSMTDSGGWNAWAIQYSTGYKPTATDVGALPVGAFSYVLQPGAALGVLYTNTTSWPWVCTIVTNHGGDDDQVRIWVGGVVVSTSSIAVSGEDSDGTQFSQTFVVPPGVSWSAEQYNGTESSITYFTQWQG